MLAYLFWHRPAEGVDPSSYERALERFHRSLAHRRPCGFHASGSARVQALPWALGGADAAGEPAAADARERAGAGASRGPAYEDWYVIDDWAALGVLEEAAVSHGHITAHDALATRAGVGSGGVYRLLEGSARSLSAPTAVWVSPAAGHERASLQALLGDGLEPARDGLWRRCLVLGPAPEYGVLAAEAPAGVSARRLPDGWSARALDREPVWSA